MAINVTHVDKTVTLKLEHDQIPEFYYNCKLGETLEKYIKEYSDKHGLKYSSIYALLGGESLFDDDFKKTLSVYRNLQKVDSPISLLIYEKNDEDIDIILSIGSTEIFRIKGEKNDIMKDLIDNSDIFPIDLKWCKFEYKGIEIDINQKFDDIANEEDKNKEKLALSLTVKLTVPVTVYIINEKHEKDSIKCLLNDKVCRIVEEYCQKKKISIYYCDIIYENKILDYLGKIFYNLISIDKIKKQKPNELLHN